MRKVIAISAVTAFFAFSMVASPARVDEAIVEKRDLKSVAVAPIATPRDRKGGNPLKEGGSLRRGPTTKAPASPNSGAMPEFQGPQGPAIQDPHPGRKLRILSLTKTSVIGGNNFFGSVMLQFVAPSGGTRVNFSTDPPFNPQGGNAALVPSGVTVPQGEANATFQILTAPVQSSRQVTIRATAGGVTKTATFTVEPIQVAGFAIAPTSGVGPFEARATIILTAPVVSDTEVTLTSSNPDVVGFGALGTQPSRLVTFQQGQNALTNISLRVRSVQQTTRVTINATLNGATQSRTVTVRPLPF